MCLCVQIGEKELSPTTNRGTVKPELMDLLRVADEGSGGLGKRRRVDWLSTGVCGGLHGWDEKKEIFLASQQLGHPPVHDVLPKKTRYRESEIVR